jgi:NADH-quinone oxidoreductase subunit E
MPFPDARAAGAAARPGELDTPALADENAARPVARTAEAAAGASGEAGRFAETGRAVARTAATMKAGAEAAAEVMDDAMRGTGRASDAPAGGIDSPPRVEEEAEEKAEDRLVTRKRAETAVDEARPAQATAELFDAAIAAAPRPDVLLAKRPENPDDLKALRGVGASLEKQLNELGVWTFEQIARMSDADLAWIDAHLTTVPGRCFRDDWVGQAKARLAK